MMRGLQVSRHTVTVAVGVLCAIPVCWAGIAFGQNAVIGLYPCVALGVWRHPYTNLAGRLRDGRLSSPRALSEVGER